MKRKLESLPYSKELGIAGLGLAVLSACGGTVGNVVHEGGEEIPKINGTIQGHLRYDPDVIQVLVEGGRNNICYDTRPEGLRVNSQVTKANDLDADGPWLGLYLGSLPKEVQKACGKDLDKKIWFSATVIDGTDN